ncbi:MAG TPA: hypothetical protein VGA37_08285 [Gemmatimonadales bacterium]
MKRHPVRTVGLPTEPSRGFTRGSRRRSPRSSVGAHDRRRDAAPGTYCRFTDRAEPRVYPRIATPIASFVRPGAHDRRREAAARHSRMKRHAVARDADDLKWLERNRR